jgi:hypothetical protein
MHSMGIHASIDSRPATPSAYLACLPPAAGPVSAPWRSPQAPGAEARALPPLTFGMLERGTAPAGNALDSGVPAPAYNPGTWNFRASLLTIFLKPTFNGAGLPAALDAAVRSIIPGASTDLSRTTLSLGGLTTVNLTEGAVRLADVLVPGGWVTVTGTLVTTAAMTLDQVNRAVARALAAITTRWTLMPNTRSTLQAPTDGAMLHSLLSSTALINGAACTGGYRMQVWARGCIRLMAAPASQSVAPVAPPLPSAPAPGAPAAPPAQGARPAPAVPALTQSCVVAPRDYFYLRPSATFATAGATRYPAGTPIALIGQTNLTMRGQSGAELRLYRVRLQSGAHVGQEGFAALSAADLQPASVGSCPTGTAIAAYAIGQSGASPAATAPARPSAPASPAAPSRPAPTQPVLTQLRGNASATKAGYYVAGASALAAAIAAGLYWKREALGLVEPKRKNQPVRPTSVPQTRIYT